MVLKLDFTPRVILLDIEGTTTSISFVKDVLFDYAAQKLQDFVKTNWQTEQMQADVDLLRKETIEIRARDGIELPLVLDVDQDDDCVQRSVIENVQFQMSIDLKSRALKQIQGRIWQHGYACKQLISHVYEDVPPAMELWKNKYGIELYIYSSGSVEAQKLLFGQTIKGNLLNFISGHFDTKVGAKIDSKSYNNIASELELKPNEVLFLTDVYKEAEAATKAGLHAVIVIRPGNVPIDEDLLSNLDTIDTFSELIFE